MRRQAGVLLPLFSLRSTADWGIGEMADIPRLASILADAGLQVLQLLPMGAIPQGESSPYSALTAFGLEPIYVSMREVPDFVALGGEVALGPEDCAALARLRAAGRVRYSEVKRLKERALRLAHARFLGSEWKVDSPRAEELRLFCRQESDWLPDYALYRALGEEQGSGSFAGWPTPLHERWPAALAEARQRLAPSVHFHEYVQWIASQQWRLARRQAAACGVQLCGDLPFVVGRDSADVWAQPDLFSLDDSLGAPPDQFNDHGQNWDLPPYRWEVMERQEHAWLRMRSRRLADLYDYFRIDHVVGIYRMYVFPRDGGAAHFAPAKEREQLALGERILRVIMEAAAGAASGAAGEATGGAAVDRWPAACRVGECRVIGEDLGAVPAFVRRSLRQLGIPGYKVLRWEKDGSRFRDPSRFEPLSLATTSTHDTESLAGWWQALDHAERARLVELPGLRHLRGRVDARFTPEVHESFLELLFASGSALAVLPFVDLLAAPDRVNTPATVGEHNWTYRLPLTIEELADGAAGRLLALVRELVHRHRRV